MPPMASLPTPAAEPLREAASFNSKSDVRLLGKRSRYAESASRGGWASVGRIHFKAILSEIQVVDLVAADPVVRIDQRVVRFEPIELENELNDFKCSSPKQGVTKMESDRGDFSGDDFARSERQKTAHLFALFDQA